MCLLNKSYENTAGKGESALHSVSTHFDNFKPFLWKLKIVVCILFQFEIV